MVDELLTAYSVSACAVKRKVIDVANILWICGREHAETDRSIRASRKSIKSKDRFRHFLC